MKDPEVLEKGLQHNSDQEQLREFSLEKRRLWVTSALFTTPLKEAVVKWGVVSSPRQQDEKKWPQMLPRKV